MTCKMRDTCDSSSEMEPDGTVDEVPTVRTAEFGPRSKDVKNVSGSVGMTLVERVNPCSLAEEWKTVIKKN